MSVPTTGWSNKGGTTDRACNCGTWKDHWKKFSKKSWPTSCSVQGCSNPPTLGGHVINPAVTGERIVPMCDSCNRLSSTFSLKGGITVTKANRSESCG